MSILDDEKTWDVVALASATLAAVATRQILKSGWTLFRGDEPPENPAARSVGWGDALAWTLATGAMVGVARLLGRRSAAAGWKKVRGRYPAGLE
ncbi:MAG: DUF4235 domain-containing protein [Gemmatimonadetes bacterium]|nr:DUF4235 domain-containing protein [Gemmatimonadota bacterium]NIQ52536.1 DUF4235 domain-containing protein [Gemmatimonadota bacterium]NIU72674.1 DUF4235 domain-containing protein [Gammaproteobacteria bacterium]NIX43080.1 DUF4235 domain-containing protein [Gemmatimonadota bacterium]NIY07240.1 DUF4235 domain-containing protein [Gemmatimonadota bacterium]